MARLDNYDKAIIHLLGNRGSSNINEISESLKISWITVHTHLIKLHKMGYLNREKEGKIFYWKLIEE